MTTSKNAGPTGGQKCSAGKTSVEDVFRRCLPILEIADPILRLASGKNKNIAPISAVVTGIVTALKKHFSSGKKTNPAALNNITELLKNVKADMTMTKEEADDLIARLKKEADKLEAAK